MPHKNRFDHYRKRGVCTTAEPGARTRDILEKKDLWRQRRSVTEVELTEDPLGLSADLLRVETATGGPSGRLRVEARSGCRMVARFEWRFAINGEQEDWLISAERRDPDTGAVYCAETAYGDRGPSFDNIGRDSELVRIFTWMVQGEATRAGLIPGWAGNFTAGSSQYELLTFDDCVSCDTPFCNC